MMAKSPADVVINAFGGVRKTAKVLKCDHSTVSLWRRSGRVPQRRHAQIIKAAGKVRRHITPRDLVSGRER